MRIFLIGFMGSGKTTIGSLLAERLGFPFVDLDSEIERRSGQSIAALFATRGERVFRQLEIESLSEATELPRAVIATGGGLAAQEGAMDLMQETGLTVWINPSFEVIARRLAATDAGQRPLFEDRESLEALFRRRLPFYRRGDLRVDVGATETAAEVAARLETSLGEQPCAT